MEQKLARLASAHKGVVTRPQLLEVGVSDREIEWRLGTGGLIRVYPGVYRVGHAAPSTESSYLAAVFACGEEAALSGRAAAWHLGILKGRPPPPEVTAPTERRIGGLTTRRARGGLHPREVVSWRGIRVTSVPRTLVDLASMLSFDDLARACHEAGVLHRTTPRQVSEVLARRPNTRGARKLRRVMQGDDPVTLSKLEKRFVQLLREHGLPRPITNRPAGAFRVDCRWPDHKLTVELDSYRFHNSRHSWEQGYRRQRDARRRRDRFRRYAWFDVFEEPRPMLAELLELLSA